MAEAVSARFDEVDAALGDENFKAVFFSSLANPTMRFANALVYAAVGVFGAFVALSGGITVGGLSAFLSYADQYAKPFNDITGVVTELQNSVACAERVFALVDEPAQLPEAEGALELGEVSGAVTLDHVRFGYAPERPILTDVDLEVAPGQRIALVGHTGCGKTTMINLLMRFYDVDAGAVRMDGHDIRDLARDEPARHVRHGAAGHVGAPRHRAREHPLRPARRHRRGGRRRRREAFADDFIRRCRGATTRARRQRGLASQPGQRQLLCIARAMLADGRMLILDEATSNIDTRTEVQVQRPSTGSWRAARASSWPTGSPPCARRPHLRGGPGPHRRAGDPRGAAGPRRPLPPDLRVAVRPGGVGGPQGQDGPHGDKDLSLTAIFYHFAGQAPGEKNALLAGRLFAAAAGQR